MYDLITAWRLFIKFGIRGFCDELLNCFNLTLKSGPCHGSGGSSSASLRRPEFDPRSVRVRLVEEKVALDQVFFPKRSGFPLSLSFHHSSVTDAVQS